MAWASDTPTIVFDPYWRFAAQRLAMYYQRLADLSALVRLIQFCRPTIG